MTSGQFERLGLQVNHNRSLSKFLADPQVAAQCESQAWLRTVELNEQRLEEARAQAASSLDTVAGVVGRPQPDQPLGEEPPSDEPVLVISLDMTEVASSSLPAAFGSGTILLLCTAIAYLRMLSRC